MRFILISILFFTINSAFAQTTVKYSNIYDYLIKSKNHTIITKIIDAPNLQKQNGQSQMSIFAPTDAAFKKFPKRLMQGNLNPTDAELIQKLMKHHASGLLLNPKNLKDGQKIVLFDGETATLNIKGGKISVDGVPVISTTSTKLGTVFVIDKLLRPKTIFQVQLEQ